MAVPVHIEPIYPTLHINNIIDITKYTCVPRPLNINKMCRETCKSALHCNE